MTSTEVSIRFFERHLKEDILKYGERQAIHMAIAALREQDELESKLRALESSGWISVEERLPEDGEKVLVYTKNGKQAVATYAKRREEFVAAGNMTATHWMKLPEKPEEDT